MAPLKASVGQRETRGVEVYGTLDLPIVSKSESSCHQPTLGSFATSQCMSGQPSRTGSGLPSWPSQEQAKQLKALLTNWTDEAQTSRIWLEYIRDACQETAAYILCSLLRAFVIKHANNSTVFQCHA